MKYIKTFKLFEADYFKDCMTLDDAKNTYKKLINENPSSDIPSKKRKLRDIDNQYNDKIEDIKKNNKINIINKEQQAQTELKGTLYNKIYNVNNTICYNKKGEEFFKIGLGEYIIDYKLLSKKIKYFVHISKPTKTIVVSTPIQLENKKTHKTYDIYKIESKNNEIRLYYLTPDMIFHNIRDYVLFETVDIPKFILKLLDLCDIDVYDIYEIDSDYNYYKKSPQ